MVFETAPIGATGDMYIRFNGAKLAVVRSYHSKQKWDGWHIEMHGVYQTDEATRRGTNCFELSDFQFVIEKHDRTIVYNRCSWADPHDEIREIHRIVAQNRWEIPLERSK